MVYQERVPAKLTALDRDEDENVFFKDEYVYGVRSRANVGFGLWQLAYASKGTLDAPAYEAARQAMMARRGDGGRPLAIRPDTLVVPPSLEGAALRIVNNTTNGTGAANEWAGTAKPIVVPWL